MSVPGRNALAGLGLLLLLTPAPAAAGGSADEQRSAWRFKRAVSVEAGGDQAFTALALPLEVAEASRADLGDLRLLDAEGIEVPFVIDRRISRDARARLQGRLVDLRLERKRGSEWVVDLEERRSFDRVVLEIPARDFAKRLRVEISDDAEAWSVVREDAGVFDRQWDTRVHHTTIELPDVVTARYLRLTTSDRRSWPVAIRGVSVSATRWLDGLEWRRRIDPRPQDGPAGVSRYLLDVRYPPESLCLDADEATFSRAVQVFGVLDPDGERREKLLTRGRVYRLSLEDAELAGESLQIELDGWDDDYDQLVLQIHDGDTPPLHELRVELVSAARRLLFPTRTGPLALYYANQATRPPVYDLESLETRIRRGTTFLAASLGVEQPNRSFRKPPPLPSAALAGASVDVTRWQLQRRLAPVDHEDLYSVLLPAEDLARLRPDLADLRIVDDQDRQVPYVLQRDASRHRVALVIDEQAARRGSDPRVSRYRLELPATIGDERTLAIDAVELDVHEPFFSRRVRLSAPSGRHGRERVIHTGELTRGTGEASQDPPPLVLPLRGSHRRVLYLEIDEGDDAPLTLRGARAVVSTPRIAFKAARGGYRLLLDSPKARSPRYDLSALRQQVLAYSAVVLEPAALEDNPAFRRAPGDYFRQAPPTLLLWGTLLAAAVILILLTLRVLRTPEQVRTTDRDQ